MRSSQRVELDYILNSFILLFVYSCCFSLGQAQGTLSFGFNSLRQAHGTLSLSFKFPSTSSRSVELWFLIPFDKLRERRASVFNSLRQAQGALNFGF